MIRKNFSLSAELKKAENKKQQRIHKRQKHDSQLKKLSDVNPIKLYEKLQRAKKQNDNSKRSQDYINTLQSDWDFIIKHKLHHDKVEPFLEKLKNQEQEKIAIKTRNHGPRSVYYNPELNPLGLIPKAENLSYELTSPIENITLPLTSHQTMKYEPDPLIKQLGIRPPPGDPPKYYKRVNFKTDISISSDDTNKRFKAN